MINLLTVGQTVELEVEGLGGSLASRVEDDAQPSRLRLSLPSYAGTTVSLAVGRTLTIIWPIDRGLAYVEAVVRAHVEDTIQLLEVEVTSEPTRLQRRDLVRAEVSGEVVLLDESGHPEEDLFWGSTINVSGAGMLVRLATATSRPEEARMRLGFDGEQPFLVTARHVREVDERTSAFEFVDFDGPEKERLIRLVFAAHRREHASRRQVRAA